MRYFLLTVLMGPSLVAADPLDFGALQGADVVIVGEVHDNPLHHQVQAEVIAELAPAAVVFEMLTPAEARVIEQPVARDGQDMRQLLEWDTSGWPDFEIYAPIFDALGQAAVYGGEVEREGAGQAMQSSAVVQFALEMEGFAHPGAAFFGLDVPLPAEEQAEREAGQLAAHCGMLPADILPGFVEAQRLRDGVLAGAVWRAMADTGGPVVVITGNGHARSDWGLPAVLGHAMPQLTVVSIGQLEGEVVGPFDIILTSPIIERPDPCAAFAN